MSTIASNKLIIDEELQTIMQRAQELYGLMASYYDSPMGDDMGENGEVDKGRPMLSAVNGMADVLDFLGEKAGRNIQRQLMDNGWDVCQRHGNCLHVKETA